MSQKRAALPLRTKTGYAVPDAGFAAMEVMLQVYLLEFYTHTAGLRPVFAGLALAIAVLWDACTDPVMGIISDETHSRWGRRRGFLFAGTIGLSLAFALLFSPPSGAGQAALFAWLLGSYLLANTCMTIAAVPHNALAAQITFDRDERTALIGWRLFFRNIGFLAGTMMPGLLAGALLTGHGQGAVRLSRQISALSIGLLLLIGMFIAIAAVAKHDPDNRAEGRHAVRRNWRARLQILGRGLLEVWRNRAFRPLLAAYVVAQAGRTLNASLALFYYRHQLRLSETQIVVGVLGFFILMVTLSIPFWLFLSKRFGKKKPAFAGALLLGIVTMVMYPLFPPGQILPVMVFASGLGGFLAGAVLLFESLVPDLVDYDELKTGNRREGGHFGFWTMCTKMCRALGLALSGGILDLVGLVPGAVEQSAETAWRITLVFGPVVGLFFAAGALSFLSMPLTRERHERVQEMLLRRRTIRLAARREQV